MFLLICYGIWCAFHMAAHLEIEQKIAYHLEAGLQWSVFILGRGLVL